jgi:hypothetical protein
MSMQLVGVSRIPRPRYLASNAADEQWLSIAADAYRHTGLRYCCHPILLADRLGLTVEKCDDRRTEIIGGTIFCPTSLTFLDRCVVIYYAIARTLILRDGKLPTSAAVEQVAGALALPRVVAMRAYLSQLPRANPFFPVEFLELIYVSYRGSGRIPAAG